MLDSLYELKRLDQPSMLDFGNRFFCGGSLETAKGHLRCSEKSNTLKTTTNETLRRLMQNGSFVRIGEVYLINATSMIRLKLAFVEGFPMRVAA